MNSFQPLTEARHRLTVVLERAIGKKSHVKICYVPEGRAGDLSAHLLFAVVGSDEK